MVIGIYWLFQKDVEFRYFGLLVVDEEYCFGVCYKECIKIMC